MEDLLLHIRRAADIESQHLEAQRVELQKQHAERIKDLQDEVGMGQNLSPGIEGDLSDHTNKHARFMVDEWVKTYKILVFCAWGR